MQEKADLKIEGLQLDRAERAELDRAGRKRNGRIIRRDST